MLELQACQEWQVSGKQHDGVLCGLRRWRFAQAPERVYAFGGTQNGVVLPNADARGLGRVLQKRGFQVMPLLLKRPVFFELPKCSAARSLRCVGLFKSRGMSSEAALH